jgi:glycosyltransferase involved in cell wall biosynthesis
MKILYVCHEPLPSPHTNTEQIVKTLANLAEFMNRIDLVYPGVPDTNLPCQSPQEKITSFYGIDKKAFDDSFNLVELQTPSMLRGKIRRPVHDIRAALYARSGNYDLVYTRDPFSCMVALYFGNKTVFETYRVDINTSLRFYPWRLYCYAKSSLLGVVTHSEMAKDSFLKAGINPESILVAYNGCSPSVDQAIRTRLSFRQALQLPVEGKIVLYAGHLNRKKGIEILLAIARLCREYHFVLVGGFPESPQWQWILKTARLQKIGNIHLKARVSPARVTEFLYAADCLIIPPSSAPLQNFRRTVLPIKTFRYLASGRPIVAPDLPDIREVLVHNHNAVLVPPDSPEDAARSLRALLADDHLLEKVSQNALSDAQKYTWKKRAAKIYSFLDKKLKENNGSEK